MSNLSFLPGGIDAGTACTCARQEMRLLCECLMWLFVIPLISTSTLVSLEMAIICEVYTLFY